MGLTMDQLDQNESIFIQAVGNTVLSLAVKTGMKRQTDKGSYSFVKTINITLINVFTMLFTCGYRNIAGRS